MNNLINFVVTNQTAILIALLAISEVLALIPSVKSNGIFQLAYNVIVKLVTKK